MLDVSAAANHQFHPGNEQLGLTSVSVALILCSALLLVVGKSKSWKQLKTEQQTVSHTTHGGARPVPGPRGIPIFGNIFQLDDKIHESFMKLAEVYGDVFQIKIASRKIVVLNGTKAIHQALVRQSTDFAGRPDLPSMSVMDETTGRALTFTTHCERWRLHRKISERALRHFTSGRQVETLQSKVMFEVQNLIDFWSNNNEDVDVVLDPERTLQLSASNVIASFLFSKRRELDDPELLSLLNLQRGFSDVFTTANMVDFMPWLLHLAPKVFNNFRSYLNQFKSFFDDTIQEHLEAHAPDADGDIMDYMLTLTDHIDQEELRRVGLNHREVLAATYDFFGAGSDTVPATLMWLLSYMVTHPDIQEAVHRELDSVLGDDNRRTPHLNDRDCLPLTEAVIAEAQRHASVIALTIPHSTTRDTVLGGGYDFEIAKDTIVFVNLHSVHYNKTVFPEPDKFIPQRFLHEDGSINREMTSQLVAFGAGRRRCIGSEIAKVELFLYFSTLMQTFRFSCPEGETVSLQGTSGLVSKPVLKSLRIKRR